MKLPALALAAVLVLATPALAKVELSDFRVVEENVRIPETQQVRSFEAIDRDSIILRAGSQYYLAKIPNCGFGAPYAENIGVDTFGPGGVDRSSSLLVDGRRCHIESLSRVERIRDQAQ